MTHRKYARTILAQLWGVKEVEGDYEDIDIIAAALEKHYRAGVKAMRDAALAEKFVAVSQEVVTVADILSHAARLLEENG